MTRVMVLVWSIGVTTDEGGESIGGPEGGVPWAMAVSSTVPALTSAWVTVWSVVAVQVVEAPGARVVARQVVAPAVGSVTLTLVRVVVPVLVTR